MIYEGFERFEGFEEFERFERFEGNTFTLCPLTLVLRP